MLRAFCMSHRREGWEPRTEDHHGGAGCRRAPGRFQPTRSMRFAEFQWGKYEGGQGVMKGAAGIART